MKKINLKRHSARIGCALLIALIVNYIIGTRQGWLPCATAIVMLTTTGSAVYQGLWRFFWLSLAVILGSLIFPQTHLLFMRMYDIILGSFIGITANIIILPDKVDIECRNAFICVLKSYAHYYSSLVNLLLERNFIDAEHKKARVEKNMQKLPGWIYETGFDLTLKKGYHYFYMKVGQMGEILFTMHGLAGRAYSEDLLNIILEPLQQCSGLVDQFIAAIITVLELKKLSEGITDFEAELIEMENRLRVQAPYTMSETAVNDPDNLCLNEFVYNLRELRSVLIRLAQALR